jgi:hypothetical protein
MSTSEEPRLLEVGDELINRSGWRGDIMYTYKIDRVTPTTAISGNTKYRRMLTKGWHGCGLSARVVGEYDYHDLATPELKKEQAEGLRRRKAMRAFDEIRPNDLTTDQLEAIAAISAIAQATAK